MIDVDPFRALTCCDGHDWMWSYEVTSPGSYNFVVASLKASFGVSIPRKMSWYWGVIHFIISMSIWLWYRLSNYSCRCFVSFYHAMPWGTHYSYLILVKVWSMMCYSLLQTSFPLRKLPHLGKRFLATFAQKRLELTQISNNLLVKAREISKKFHEVPQNIWKLFPLGTSPKTNMEPENDGF